MPDDCQKSCQVVSLCMKSCLRARLCQYVWDGSAGDAVSVLQGSFRLQVSIPWHGVLKVCRMHLKGAVRVWASVKA